VPAAKVPKERDEKDILLVQNAIAMLLCPGYAILWTKNRTLVEGYRKRRDMGERDGVLENIETRQEVA
jgi:hypothetical protein